jgi:hypothetical protein
MKSASGRHGTVAAIALATGLYLLWVLATYLLEGRIHTLLSPEAMGARLSYALTGQRPHRDRRLGPGDPLPL